MGEWSWITSLFGKLQLLALSPHFGNQCSCFPILFLLCYQIFHAFFVYWQYHWSCTILAGKYDCQIGMQGYVQEPARVFRLWVNFIESACSIHRKLVMLPGREYWGQLCYHGVCRKDPREMHCQVFQVSQLDTHVDCCMYIHWRNTCPQDPRCGRCRNYFKIRKIFNALLMLSAVSVNGVTCEAERLWIILIMYT